MLSHLEIEDFNLLFSYLFISFSALSLSGSDKLLLISSYPSFCFFGSNNENFTGTIVVKFRIWNFYL